MTETRGQPRVVPQEAEIIPLIWNARIGKANITIPLSSIEHYGIQDYTIDGSAHIRELTITTKSLSMVRIYHILPFAGVNREVAERLEQGRDLIEERLQIRDPDLPIKTYPTTTHEKMVEYRVSLATHIDDLYKSLNDAMVTYLGRELIREQREKIITQIVIPKADGKSGQE